VFQQVRVTLRRCGSNIQDKATMVSQQGVGLLVSVLVICSFGLSFGKLILDVLMLLFFSGVEEMTNKTKEEKKNCDDSANVSLICDKHY